MDLETLERRRLLSVSVVEGYPGFYEVYGTPDSDVIAVAISAADSSFTVDGVQYGGASSISIFAGPGDDFVSVSADGPTSLGATVEGGPGNDDLSVSGGGGVWGGGGNDTLRLNDCYRGEIHGGSGDDHLYVSGACADAQIEGEQGNDLIDATASATAVIAAGGGGDDTIFGSQYDDELYGESGSDLLVGGAGNDIFYSAELERDRLIGGAGVDVAFVDASESGIWGVEYVYYV